MNTFLTITKALADENRVRALLALGGGELCVCQIVELLGLAPSTVSKHLSILKHARLIEGRKHGRWMYYRLADIEAPAEVRDAIAWVYGSPSNALTIRQDDKRLKEILKIDPVELCKRQLSK
jgi:DNA-binding transcriptional ArsR family regulator